MTTVREEYTPHVKKLTALALEFCLSVVDKMDILAFQLIPYAEAADAIGLELQNLPSGLLLTEAAEYIENTSGASLVTFHECLMELFSSQLGPIAQRQAVLDKNRTMTTYVTTVLNPVQEHPIFSVDVGGTIAKTASETILLPDTMFSGLFSDLFGGPHYEEDGCVFIDRDGVIFQQWILPWLRLNEFLHIFHIGGAYLTQEHTQGVLREAMYYGLDALVEQLHTLQKLHMLIFYENSHDTWNWEVQSLPRTTEVHLGNVAPIPGRLCSFCLEFSLAEVESLTCNLFMNNEWNSPLPNIGRIQITRTEVIVWTFTPTKNEDPLIQSPRENHCWWKPQSLNAELRDVVRIELICNNDPQSISIVGEVQRARYATRTAVAQVQFKPKPWKGIDMYVTLVQVAKSGSVRLVSEEVFDAGII